MMLFTFAHRHMWRHWRVNLLLLAGLLLAAAFLAGLPPYATAIAGRSLSQRLESATPATRNMRVEGSGLNAALYARFQSYFGDLVVDRIDVRTAAAPGDPALRAAAGDRVRPFDEFLALNLYAFSDLSQHVTVTAGRLPQHVTTPPNQFYAVTEAVIGLDAAENANLSLSTGDSVQVQALEVGDQVWVEGGSLRLNIVGIVTPSEPASDVWWGDLLPFSFLRQSLHGPSQPETVTLSLILPPASMDAYRPDRARTWRVLTDPTRITVDNAARVQQAVGNARAQLRVNIESGLETLIERYQAELDTARITLFLLTAQSMIFVLYALATLSSFWLAQSQRELASLAGRGFTRRQLVLAFGWQSLWLALPAAPLGPLLAQAGLAAWGRLSGTVVPSAVPVASWWLALAAAGVGWVTLLMTVAAGLRGDLLAWQRAQARPPRRAGWQKVYLDFFLLILGGLIYWQLAETGTFVVSAGQLRQEVAGPTDPLLLIGPTLLLVAVALVFLRLFPLLLRLFAWWSRRRRGLLLPFGLARLSRDPVGPSRVVLLISLAAGLTLFASLFEHSLARRQAEMSRHLTGADLRVGLPIGADATAVASLAEMPGVTAVAPVYVNNRSRWAPNLGRQVAMLAVDPENFGRVAAFAPFISRLTVPGILPVLTVDGGQAAGDGGPVPAVFSQDAYPQDKQVGDEVVYIVGQHKVTFVVQGIIRTFPSLSGPFMITNLPAVERRVPLETLTEPWVGRREAWLAVDPAAHEAVTQRLADGEGPAGATVVADARGLERTLQEDLIARETQGAFALNAATLMGVSAAMFLMVHCFTARQRTYDFSVLRAMGMSTRQLLGLLGLEGVLMVVLGLVAGAGIGYGLALIVRPFLSSALSAAIAGNAIYQIVVDWGDVSGLFAVLIASYAVALLLLMLVLLQSRIHRTLRLGDE